VLNRLNDIWENVGANKNAYFVYTKTNVEPLGPIFDRNLLFKIGVS
jgi:hypothetical protein